MSRRWEASVTPALPINELLSFAVFLRCLLTKLEQVSQCHSHMLWTHGKITAKSDPHKKWAILTESKETITEENKVLCDKCWCFDPQASVMDEN